MVIKTSIGDFTKEEFISRCNDRSFPEGLEVPASLNLKGYNSLTALPDGLKVGGSLDLTGCKALTALPAGIKVGGSLYLNGCRSLMALPDGLHVGGHLYLAWCTSLTVLPVGVQIGGSLFLPIGFIEQYSFKDLPKILHLSLDVNSKHLIIERLNDYR
jgi:hypothetical protein